jgi:NAD-dependent dihydropyrimidine dehydrogenase PreA subunit
MYKWMPVVDESRCTGCGSCVEACGPNSLALIEGVAVLTLPDTCGSEEHCIPACPEDALRMAWLPFTGDMNRGQWSNGTQDTATGGHV